MRNWPVIIVLLVILLGLLVAGFINRSKANQHSSHGCFNRGVTLPDFIVLQSCAREEGLTGGLIDKIYVVRKAGINAVVHVPERGDECSQVSFSGNQRALVYGSIEELTLRIQPGYVDYGECGPAAHSFMKMLEGYVPTKWNGKNGANK